MQWLPKGSAAVSLLTARSSRKDHEPGLSVMRVVNMHRQFAVVPVMEKTAARSLSLFAGVLTDKL